MVFRRCTDQKEMKAMESRDGGKIAALVKKKLKTW
jgi:hypothetical protein